MRMNRDLGDLTVFSRSGQFVPDKRLARNYPLSVKHFAKKWPECVLSDMPR
jgi:hypothetical protein